MNNKEKKETFADITRRLQTLAQSLGILPTQTSVVIGDGFSAASQQATPFTVHLAGDPNGHQFGGGDGRSVIVLAATNLKQWTAAEIVAGLIFCRFAISILLSGDEAKIEAFMGSESTGGLPRGPAGVKPYLAELGIRHASERNGLPAGNKTRLTPQRFQPVGKGLAPQISDMKSLQKDFWGCTGTDADGKERDKEEVNSDATDKNKAASDKADLKEAEEKEAKGEDLAKVNIGSIWINAEQAEALTKGLSGIDPKLSATQKARRRGLILTAFFAAEFGSTTETVVEVAPEAKAKAS